MVLKLFRFRSSRHWKGISLSDEYNAVYWKMDPEEGRVPSGCVQTSLNRNNAPVPHVPAINENGGYNIDDDLLVSSMKLQLTIECPSNEIFRPSCDFNIFSQFVQDALLDPMAPIDFGSFDLDQITGVPYEIPNCQGQFCKENPCWYNFPKISVPALSTLFYIFNLTPS